MCSELLRCCSTCTLTLPHRLLCVPCVRASQTVNTAGKIIAWTILRPFDKANELKAGDSTLTLYSPRTKPSIAHMTKKFTLPGAKLVVHIDTDDDEEKDDKNGDEDEKNGDEEEDEGEAVVSSVFCLLTSDLVFFVENYFFV